MFLIKNGLVGKLLNHTTKSHSFFMTNTLYHVENWIVHESRGGLHYGIFTNQPLHMVLISYAKLNKVGTHYRTNLRPLIMIGTIK